MPNIQLKYLLFIILLYSSLSALSQRMVIYKEDRELSAVFSYDTYDDDASLPNFFINKLSDSQSKMRSFFKYSISANTKTTLIKNKNKYSLNIQIDSINIKGNFDYRGFNFQKSCLPWQVWYSYDIYENNKKKSQERTISVNIYDPTIINFDTSFTDSTNIASFTIKSESLAYSFSQEQRESFRKSIEYISYYYSEGKIIEQVNKDIAKLNVNNIDKIILQSIDIKYINKRFNKIKIPNYQEQLSLSETDPAGIYKNYLQTKATIDTLYSLYKLKLNVLDSLFYARAMDLKLDSNHQESLIYLNKSIDFNPEFLPSLYQLALYQYENEKYLESEKYLDDILLISSKYKDANNLALLNYRAMLDQGISLNKQERYTEGLQMLKHAKAFCTKNIHVIFCDSVQEPAIEAAKLGIYKSYISIAGASMRRGRFDMTESYLESASRYQKKFPEAIINNKEAENLYTLLITQYLRLSIESASNYKQREANNYIHHADSLAQAHAISDAIAFVEQTKLQLKDKNYTKALSTKENIIRNTMVEKQEYSTVEIAEISPLQVAKNSYYLHLNKGMSYMHARKYSKAYSNFVEAKSVCEASNFNCDKVLDKNIHYCAKYAIIAQLDKASLHAWASRFKTADLLLNKSLKEIEANKLEDDSLIQAKIEFLKTEILKKADSKQSIVFNKIMKRARQSIDFRDYTSMKTYCDSAIHLAENSYQIQLNIEYPKSLLKKFNNEIDYQEQVQVCKQFSDNKEYNKAIMSYILSHKLYKLVVTKIKEFTLGNFANYAKTSSVTNYAIEQSLQQANAEQAFNIWQNAVKDGINIEDGLAISLMNSLAKIDIAKYPNSDNKSLYNIRFGKTKTYKKYKRHYYKGLKK